MTQKSVLGLSTVTYAVQSDDFKKATTWYEAAFKTAPYYQSDFYMGFNIGGYELGILPYNEPPTPKSNQSVAYWRVNDIQSAVEHFQSLGAVLFDPIEDVGDDILVASLKDPFGNVIGLIQNPNFKLP